MKTLFTALFGLVTLVGAATAQIITNNGPPTSIGTPPVTFSGTPSAGYVPVATGATGVSWFSDPAGLLVTAAGAKCDGTTDDRAVIQAALNTQKTAGGGTVVIPATVNGCKIAPPVSGCGIVLPDSVRLVGLSKAGNGSTDSNAASALYFSGTFTDSHICGSTRDDNNVGTWDVVALENLHIITSGSAVALLDVTGMRYSSFVNLQMQGSAAGIADVMIRISDRNPAHTSNKSTFFNTYQSIGTYGPEFGTCILYEETAGNSNSNSFSNFQGGCRIAMDFTAAVGYSIDTVFSNMYFAGDSNAASTVFASGTIPATVTFLSLAYEGYTTVPTGVFSGVYTSTLSVTGASSLSTLGLSGTGTVTKSIGATSTDGQVLTNTTAAAVNAQQWSPRLRLTGQGWKTTATAASQTVDWIVENQPVQGASSPSSNLVMSSQINGGGFLPGLTVASNGLVTVGSTSANVGGLQVNDRGGTANYMLLYKSGGANILYDSIGGGIAQYSQNQFQFNAAAVNVLVNSTTDATTAATGSFQVAGGATIAKRVFLSGITASSGLQTAVLCLSSGNEVIADSVACLASSERFKENIASSDIGLATVLALQPKTYDYRLTGNDRFDNAPNQRARQVGFLAEDAARIDPRLVALDADGNVRTFRYENYVAVLTKAIQELNSQIETLKRKTEWLDNLPPYSPTQYSAH